MRRFHRIISLIAGVFLTLITVTGILLHINEFLEEEDRQSPQHVYNLAQGIPPEWSTALNKGLAEVSAKKANIRIERIRIDLENEKPRFIVQTGGEERMNYMIGIDGAILKATRPQKSLLFRLHTGEIIGETGEILNVFFGLGLLFLLATGFVMLWDIFRAAPNTRTAIRRIFGIKP